VGTVAGDDDDDRGDELPRVSERRGTADARCGESYDVRRVSEAISRARTCHL
jgi:hypothetical protein